MKLKYYLRGLGIGMAVTAVILHFSVYTSVPVLTNEEIMERARQLGMIDRVVLSENESLANTDNDITADSEDGHTDISGESDDPTDEQDNENPSDAEENDDGNNDDGIGDSDESDGDDVGNNAGEDNEQGNGNNTGEEDARVTTNNAGENNTQGNGNNGDEDYIPGGGNNDNDGSGAGEQVEGMGGTGEMGETIVITIVGGDSSVSVAAKLAQAGLVSSGAAYDDYLCSNGYDRRITTGVHVIPMGASEKEIAEIITTRQ